MPPRPPKEIEFLAQSVAEALATDRDVTVANADAVKAAVRAAIRAADKTEADIEAEADAILRARGREIVSAQMDRVKLLEAAKREIAKKKGFPL